LKTDAKNYVIRAHDDPAAINATSWNALLDSQDAPTPFLRHEYLSALHRSRSAVPDTGWAPTWLAIEHRGTLLAACTLYLKAHSYGEYVFDWAWADAYQRHGLAYYPKLLGAVPFTPVPGSRLLAVDDAARDVLLQAVLALARQQGLSSAHLLFLSDADRAACERMGKRAGWMLREGVQFHWQNREPEPYAGFDDSRAACSATSARRSPRAPPRQRGRCALRSAEGAPIDASAWDFF
jgi:predicted N-acyltransferase